MDRHAGDVIQHESFSNLSRESLRAIISRFVKTLIEYLLSNVMSFGQSDEFSVECLFDFQLTQKSDLKVVQITRNSLF